VDAFLVSYLLGSEAVVRFADDIPLLKARLEYQYPNLNETAGWMEDLRRTLDLERSSRRNPFVTHPVTFDDLAALVLQVGHSFGSFQNLECHTLKRKLTEMEHAGNGRVLLSRFYSNALAGGWEFMESVEYLRNQGALDESNPDSPSVVIPNYINSRMNCLTASEFYASCCLNECDGILERLESRIAAPSAEPARIAEIVSGLPSDTVDAPRNLSSALLARLDEIALTHGRVPLHGRLFAQWMHHAYPRECPFPHISGSVNPMHPAEWAAAMGEDSLEVSQEIMEMHALNFSQADAMPAVIPWRFEEELVAEHRQDLDMRTSLPGLVSLKVVSAVVALVSFAVPLVHTVKVALASPSSSKTEKHMV